MYVSSVPVGKAAWQAARSIRAGLITALACFGLSKWQSRSRRAANGSACTGSALTRHIARSSLQDDRFIRLGISQTQSEPVDCSVRIARSHGLVGPPHHNSMRPHRTCVVPDLSLPLPSWHSMSPMSWVVRHCTFGSVATLHAVVRFTARPTRSSHCKVTLINAASVIIMLRMPAMSSNAMRIRRGTRAATTRRSAGSARFSGRRKTNRLSCRQRFRWQCCRLRLLYCPPSHLLRAALAFALALRQPSRHDVSPLATIG